MRSVYRRDVKKRILMVINIIFGIYIVNTKIPFLGDFNLPGSANDILILITGILLILNFFYLLFFARRMRIY
ncbi:MAG: hypothetical protein NUV46_00820 [Nanoarchaeota archaeon]|nr:hypothetical protein [Nanoarchaeota archaeon]